MVNRACLAPVQLRLQQDDQVSNMSRSEENKFHGGKDLCIMVVNILYVIFLLKQLHLLMHMIIAAV